MSKLYNENMQEVFIFQDNPCRKDLERIHKQIQIMKKAEVLKFPFKRKGFSKNRKFQ